MLGVWWGWQRERRIVIFGLAWVVLAGTYAFWYNTDDSYVYLLPVLPLLAVWWAMGVQYLLDLASSWRSGWRHVVLVAILALPFASLALHWQAVDVSDDHTAHAYVNRILLDVGPGGLVIARGDRPTFALWYGVYAEGRRPDTAVINAPLLDFAWYRDNVRALYPDLILNEPDAPATDIDEMVRDLIEENLERRPVYATDPAQAWNRWFDLRQDGEAELYRVRPRN
jgi:hypothetical protein